MSLAKYQVEALVSEVRDRIKESQDEIKDSEQYEEEVQNVFNETHDRLEYEQYKELEREKKELSDRLQEVRSELKERKRKVKEETGMSIGYGMPFNKILKQYSEKQALKNLGALVPYRKDIENAIIISDLSGADDIIETVIDKLS